jgi:uncharacterized protein
MLTESDYDKFQVLIVPPWTNAGEEHWQSLWEKKYPGFIRVEQRDWENPDLREWVATLDDYVGRQNRPVLIVAHSLGSATAVHWASRFKREIAGAFLVAPPDVEAPDAPSEITSFSPLPLARLNFPSMLVASENDNYMSLNRSKFFAEKWGSELINVGRAGHLNVKAGFGEWAEGEKLLQKFIKKLRMF